MKVYPRFRSGARVPGAATLSLAALVAIAPLGAAPPLAHADSRPPPKSMQLSWWDRTDPARGGGARSRHYRLRSDLSSAETAELGRHLDIMYGEYQRRLGSLEQRSPEVLDVLVFRSQAEYLSTLRERFGINGLGSGGMFFTSPRGAALAFFVESLPPGRVAHVMQHEGFHQYAFSRFGNDLPPWVNEGLAEFFGESVVVNGTVVVGQTSQRTLDTLRKAIDAQKALRFRELVTMDGERWNANVRNGNALLQYMQAWSMVHFLVYGDGGRYTQSFEQYLRLMNRGTASYEAFVRAFGTDDLEAFESRWIEHTKTARPSAFVTAMERVEFLGQGLKFLAEKGLRPTDLEALRLALIEAKFSAEVGGFGGKHGASVTLSADDELNFQIPDDDLAKGTPTFELVPSKPRRGASRRERDLEERSPLPAGIVTQGLAPKNLVLRWVRDDEGDGYRFEVTVK